MDIFNKLTSKYVKEDFTELKRYASEAKNKSKHKEALLYIKTSASIAYHLNFCFTDMELEQLLVSIGKDLVKVQKFQPNVKRYLFYDSFGIDNRGLTHQYISALKQTNCEFLCVLCNENNLDSCVILSELAQIANASVKIIDYNLNDLEKIDELVKIINEFKPQKAFLHMLPWDVVGVTAWGAFKCVTKYLVNLTDHAFWLGVSCLDYCIEFREYGATISIEQRGISLDKLKYLLFYPIFNSEKTSFMGLPETNSDNIIIFSGGALYKVYGEDGLFFRIIKRILNDNPKVIIFFAGTGETRPFKNFIKKNRLESRLFLIGPRKDLQKVFEKIDLYLCTFPVNGGLMSLLASANRKLVISYTYPNLPFNRIDQLYNFSYPEKITFTDLEEYHDEVNRAIENRNYREEKAIAIHSAIPTKDQFLINFQSLVENDTKYNYVKESNFDRLQFSELFLNIENDYLKSYHLIKIQHLKFCYLKSNFLKACYSMCYILFQNTSFLKNKLKSFNFNSIYVQK